MKTIVKSQITFLLVDEYTQNKMKLYACFIDFKKAFDNV